MKARSQFSRLSIAGCLLSAVMSTSAAHADLVGYWPLDGNGNAIVGTNGSLVNGPIAAVDRNNMAGGAIAFNGASQQYVNIAGGGGLNNLPAATISMWVYWSGTQDAACCGGPTYGNVIARQTNGVSSANIIGLSTNNPLTANVTLQPYTAGTPSISAGGPLAAGWHHIATTMTNNDQRLYIDGVLVGSSAVAHNLGNNPATPLTIGAWAGDGGGYSTSTIDEVGTFNQALTPGKAMALYSAAVEPDLEYTLDNIDLLFDVFDTQGEVTIGDLTWEFATPQQLQDEGMLGGLGQITSLNGTRFAILLDNGVGGLVTTIPEPTSVALWSILAGATLLGAARCRRRK